ncbi:hypothetical protein [Dactylosporangium sp. NPDC000521]|uniref:DUF7426 family protein n=1 Tax=Dactylosporangium sp. NPDC000521 TaxID=3363975 RepID=UPI00368A32C9
MAKFEDLDRYWDPRLTLTVRGKQYTLPLPSGELGLWCRQCAAVAGEVNAASTDDELHAAVAAVEAIPDLPGKLTLHERVLGDVYQQLLDDEVPDPYIQFCGQTAYIWIIGGEGAAERYWTSGGRPELMARGNRATRRASTQTTSTAAASATQSPGSTSGTSSRPRSRRSGRGGASRGHRS